jgi:uncharacterized membrane protein
MRREMKHAAARTVGLGVVLAAVVGTMGLGIALKAPCAAGNWGDGRQYKQLCYSDIVPLLGTEQLTGNRLPYLDPCRESANNCDEYPVLTMYVIRVAAWVAIPRVGLGEPISEGGYERFYYANAILLTAAGGGVAACLWRLVGRRALWFALAPTLLIYGTMNWDLFAVALSTAALVAFAARRDVWAGVLVGLGAAAKFYPGLLLIPLFFQALRDHEPDRSVRLLWWSVGTWLAVNLPFAVSSSRGSALFRLNEGWSEFFRFNATRTADFDSGWYIACDLWHRCFSTSTVNIASAGLFLGIFALLWWAKARRNPRFSRWTLGFPLLAVLLLTNKVYSPQYGLWLLPWFVLALPSLSRFVAFQVTDVAVFVTRFWFFGAYTGVMSFPRESWFRWALAARALVLIWCLLGWLRADPPPLALGSRGWRAFTRQDFVPVVST